MGKGQSKNAEKWEKAEFRTRKGFAGHFETHGQEFGLISKGEYLSKAQDLLAQGVDRSTIVEYEMPNGHRVRYNVEKNEMAIGQSGRVVTLYRPRDGRVNYEEDLQRELELQRKKKRNI